MAIQAGQVTPQDNLSSTNAHEDKKVTRELLFLSKFSDRVVALELFDATTNLKLASLSDGMVITITNPSLNINAIVEGKRTRSVVQEWTNSEGKSSSKFKNTAPYTMCSNNKLDFYPCANLGFGEHNLSAKACSKRNGQGKCTTPFVMTIQIIRPLTNVPVVPTAPTKAPDAPKEAPASNPVAPMAPAVAPSALVESLSKSSLATPKAQTVAPGASPVDNCTVSAIHYLNCNTLTGRTLSLTGTTQEDKAAQWVVEVDALQLIPDTDATRTSLLQRYALSTLLRDGVGLSRDNECF